MTRVSLPDGAFRIFYKKYRMVIETNLVYLISMKILNFIALFLMGFVSLVQAQEEKILNLNNGSQLYIVASLPQSVENKPTLIFLPGIYRGYLPQETFLHVLKSLKINWIALHFSRHPESIVAGSSVWNGIINSETLAKETLAVKKAFQVNKPIVVSLSYSTSVVPHLKREDFPVVVETAPMGRADETLPPTPAYGWNPWMAFFPIIGSWMNVTAEYWGYRYYWMMKVQELTRSHPRYRKQSFAIAEGLAQLAYSSRSFDLRNQDFEKGPDRFWILGENEMAFRKKIQLEAIASYQEAKRYHESSTYLIPEAGHNVPIDQPEAYARTLNTILMSVARSFK